MVRETLQATSLRFLLNDSSHQVPNKIMNARIFFWSLTSALAGFLFGFDTVVISGAEKTIQALWGLSPGLHGIAMASALYGTVVGSLLGGWPADRFGRKATLLWIGVLYFVGAVGSALAPNVSVFILARVIGGLGIGISTVVAPMYISEIAPPKHRGRLAGGRWTGSAGGSTMASTSLKSTARCGPSNRSSTPAAHPMMSLPT